MEAAERIGQSGADLTRAERRVAEVVLTQPQLVAFGTVAELASAAGAGAATVVRLATKLGYDGFTELQAVVQRDLARQLRPAAERIRAPAATDAISRHLELELENVRATLGGLDADAMADTLDHLADPGRRIFLLSGDASLGVAMQFAADLSSLRSGVGTITGNDVAVHRQLALLDPSDVVVTIDLRRYDRWLVEAATKAKASGAWCLAITDSLLSPLTGAADRTLVIEAASAGPFDSHVGTLALLNLLAAGVGDRLRTEATERLDRMEIAWRENDSLTDR
jgi:DNA-binding MurR/RpiR family transcriptional regulator